MSIRIGILAVWALAAVLLAAPRAAADGKVFLNHPTYATIPDQSALIAWKDGVQTLAIETRFLGERAEAAWVVPLPAAPVSIEPATTGLFPTLRSVVVPRVNDRTRLPEILALLSLLVLVWCAARKPFSLRRLVIGIVVIGLIWAALPNVGPPRYFRDSFYGVRVLERRIIGAFDTAVISGDRGEALVDWLNQHGYTVDPAVAPVANAYAREGWVFAAARLRDDHAGDGPRAPHPLVFRFKADQPVYPLRLTGVNNGPLTVDLFVFAEQRASIAGWETLQCRRVWSAAYFVPPVGLGARDAVWIEHDACRDLIGGLPWLTRLRTELSPDAMRHDALIEWRPPRVIGARALSFPAAFGRALAWGLGAALLVSVAGLALCLGRYGVGITRPHTIAAALAAAVVTGGVVYASDPPVRTSRMTGIMGSIVLARVVGSEVNQIAHNAAKADPSFVVTEEWARRTVASVIADAKNLWSGPFEALREEDSPGNYIIRTNGAGVVEFVRFGSSGEASSEPILRDR